MKAFGGHQLPDTASDALSLPAALIVWDMQEAIAPRSPACTRLEAAIDKLGNVARSADIPVIYSQHFSLPIRFESPGYVRDRWRQEQASSPAQLRPLAPWGSPQSAILATLTPREDDIVLPKTRPNFFYGTPLDQVLRGIGVQTLVFTGVATDKGILTTAREAVLRGYFCVTVADACGSFSEAEQANGLRELATIGFVVDTSHVLSAWLRGEGPPAD